MTHPALSLAWSTASNLGAAVVRGAAAAPAAALSAGRAVGDAARFAVVAPPDRQPPEGFPVLLARTLEQTFPDGPPPGVVPYVTARLAREGYDPGLFNSGALRCLCAHDHAAAVAAGDDRCAPRQLASAGGVTVYLRRYPSQAEGLQRLLAVALYRTGAAVPTPLCPWCGERDAEREVVTSPCARVASGASVAGIGDDITAARSNLSTAWTICKLCRSFGANLGAAPVEEAGAEDVAVAVVEDADGAGTADDVSGLGLAVLGVVVLATAVFGSYAAWAIVKLRGVAERLNALGLRFAGSGEPLPAGWVAIDSRDPLWNQARAAFRDEGAWARFAMDTSGLRLIRQAAGATPEARAVNAALANSGRTGTGAGVKDATHGAPSHDEVGVAGYHSRDPNATETPPPVVSGELPDLGDDEVAGVVEGIADPIVDGTMDGTLDKLADAWSKVIATRDASPPDCACRQATGPLIAEWVHYRDGEGAAEGEGFARQWRNLRRAQAAQSSAALLPPEGGDFTVDVRNEEEWAANPRPGAVNVPIRDEEGGGDLVARVAEVAPRRESARIVIFCKSGVRAGRACALLTGAGWHACNGHEESCPIPDATGPLGAPGMVPMTMLDGSLSYVTDAEARKLGAKEDTGGGWTHRDVRENVVAGIDGDEEIVVVEVDDGNLGADPGRVAAAIFTGGASEGALAAKRAADSHNAAQRRRRESRERRVQEFVATHDRVRERARRDAAAGSKYAPAEARWRQTFATYTDPDTTDDADLTTAADDLGAIFGVSDAERTRIKNLRARASTHNEAVQEGRANVGDEPELVEYLKRWVAFVEQLKALDATADATFGGTTGLGTSVDTQIQQADAQFNLLLGEWPLVKSRIELRRGKKVVAVLETALTGPDGKPLPALPPEQRTKTSITVPNIKADLPPSAATTAPASPPGEEKASPWPWVGAGVAALALGKLALKAAVGAVVEDDA